jgi:hypothetical protein
MYFADDLDLLTPFKIFIEYDNSSVGEEEHFEMRHLVQALLDWQVAMFCATSQGVVLINSQVWLHILIYMSIIGPCKDSPLLLLRR